MVKSFALFMPPRIRVGELISPFLGASVRNVFDSRRGDIGSPWTMGGQWKALRSLHWLIMVTADRFRRSLGRLFWGVFSRVPIFGPAPFAIGCHAVGVLVEFAAE
jgi:hypothetical protein